MKTMEKIPINKLLQRSGYSSNSLSLVNQVKAEKIVDYPFEKNEKSNVLAIHQTRPLIAYLITIQRPNRISKAWSASNELLDSNSSSSTNPTDKNKTVSIRIIDYVTKQKCLARGIYHARPADCAFTINSTLCTHLDVIKMAVVDRLSNVYLYDLTYSNDDLTSTRTLVIRSPFTNDSIHNSINIAWCPYVPCEDFDDGDGGLRLSVSTNSCIEIFAIDRLLKRSGDLQRSELKGSYKLIKDAHSSKIVSLNISPDCSTISAVADDNKVKFFSSDIDDNRQNCIHSWDAKNVDGPIVKLFFLDDYPKLLENSAMKFWGAAFIATKLGQIILIDLQSWTVYQSLTLKTEPGESKNFNYQIDFTSKCIIAINGMTAFVINIQHDHKSNSISLPKMSRVTKFPLHSQVYSYVVKHKSEDEVDLFTISANSLERFSVHLNAPDADVVEDYTKHSVGKDTAQTNSTPQKLQRLFEGIGPSANMLESMNLNDKTQFNSCMSKIMSFDSSGALTVASAKPTMSSGSVSKSPKKIPENLDVVEIDRLVENLFKKLNVSFSQGLEEFLTDVKSEVGDLTSKMSVLTKEVRRLQLQLQDVRQRLQ